MDLITKQWKKVLSLFLCCVFFVGLCGGFAADDETVGVGNLPTNGVGGDYTDNTFIAKRLDVVFSEFPVGTFFSYTGKPCTCHNKCSYWGGCDCISIYSDPEKNGKEIYLYSIQCMGFAHYVFYKLFGYIDSINYDTTVYHSLGSLPAGKVTAASARSLLSSAKTGADIRVRDKHSMILLTQDQDGLMVLQANWAVPCMVNISYWTWEQFASRYNAYGIEYVNMPNEYPSSDGEYIPPEPKPPAAFEPGRYRVTPSVGLRLRSGPGTDTQQLALVPENTELEITEIQNNWGKTIYDGKEGWVSMEYTEWLGPLPLPSLDLTALHLEVPAECEIFYRGQALDFSVLKVVGEYSDDSRRTLTAEEYTLQYDFPSAGDYTVSVISGEVQAFFEVRILPAGDLDVDGKVSMEDMLLFLRILDGTEVAGAHCRIGGDLNRDGQLTEADAQVLMRYLAGLETELVCGPEESVP